MPRRSRLRWLNWPPSGTACPLPSGLGSWPWCGLREGKAGLGDERSGTAPAFDRQASSPLAGLNLFAVPSSPGEEPFPGAAKLIRCPSAAQLNPPRTDSLTEMKAFPTVEPKSGEASSPERSSEEKSSEPAKHQKTSPRFFTAHGD